MSPAAKAMWGLGHFNPVVNNGYAVKDRGSRICFAELDVGFIDEGSDIVGVFHLELVPLQNLIATLEGYRVGHMLSTMLPAL